MIHLIFVNIATKKSSVAITFLRFTVSTVFVMFSIHVTLTPTTQSKIDRLNFRILNEQHLLLFRRKINNFYHDLFETDKKWALMFSPKLESKIFVHSHYETFGWDYRPHIVWQPEFSAELLISMKQTYTTDDARQLSIGQRKCIFPNEIELDIFKEEYSFSGCMKECRMKKSMKLCHCIAPFYRPSGKPFLLIFVSISIGIFLRFCHFSKFQCLTAT